MPRAHFQRFKITLVLLLVGCGPSVPAGPVNSVPPVPAPMATGDNALSVTVDGTPWMADRELWGAVNPPGFGRVVIISGSRGPKDASEQAFTLTLHGIDTPGRHRVHSGDVTSGVAQLAGLSEQRFLIGGALGYDLQVELTMAQQNPVRIEATFEGTLVANDGGTVTFRNGRFTYRE
jgi:hypothetical protein